MSIKHIVTTIINIIIACHPDCYIVTYVTFELTALKCHRLSAPQYGRVRTKTYTVGSKSEYSCIYGYRLVGKSTRTCQYDEQWSGKAPICERMYIAMMHLNYYHSIKLTCCLIFHIHVHEIAITCQKPEKPDHGQVYASSLKVASRASYRCDYGYKLFGSARRRCQNNGKWSGEAPICERK